MIPPVGCSRMHLGDHDLSDVVNGFLAGAFRLVAGVAASEALAAGFLPPSPPRRGLALAAGLPVLAIGLLVAALSDKPVAPVAPPP